MEVTALCIRLLMNVLTVLVAQVQNGCCAQKDAFPRVVPNRLQFYEYESISVHCEFDGSAEWTVMRTLQETAPTNTSYWVTSAGSGTIKPAFSSDSGEYWCEDGDGLRSNAVNITVTAGFVVLESPVLPVTEGDNVTLHCKKKKSSTDSIADFYKDGIRIRTGYKGSMTIYNVSSSDEGLYKCNISGAGESPESWLAVRGKDTNEPTPTSVFSEPPEEAPQGHSPDLLTPLSLVVAFLLLAVLLLVVGVVCCRRRKGTQDKTDGSTTTETRSDDVGDPCNATYAVVKKPRKKKVTGSDNPVDPQHVTYASVTWKERDPNASKAGTTSCLPKENVVYASVNVSVDR